jgi:uncharacterized membrane protein HdeD (DUF308 family)
VPLAAIAVTGALCIMVGVYWDISWHMTIGRDSFWTPAHLLIQAGGILAGATSGFVALRTTFRGNARERETGVSFWGFRAPLGAWVCVWGCAAMVTSAPFDNWWHDAYGLDVKIVSPPHTVLAAGIYAICWGALLLTLARQNRAEPGSRDRRQYEWLYIVAGGLLIMNFAVFLTEYSIRHMQHGPEFYRVSALFYPFALVAIARGSTKRWAATLSAATYMAVMLVLMWVIQLFPATPKLGPIYQPITRMVAMAFPLWLIVPGFVIDLVRHRTETTPQPVRAAILGVTFVAAFLTVQWPFATFLVENPASRNWFWNADNYVYWATPSYVATTHSFPPLRESLGAGLAIACVLASLSAWLGLAWGGWMTRVRR